MPAGPMKLPLDLRAVLRSLSPRVAAAGAALVLAACWTDAGPPKKEEAGAGHATTAPERVAPAAPGPGESWNTAQIEWYDHASGLARAKAENRPAMVVVYTTWCPHCKNYSHVFEDPKVVQQAKDFVMIRVDADQESDVAKRYAKDGSYIPRTFFVAPDGTPDFEVHAQRPKYAYFYDERDPSSVLRGMEEAKRRLRK